LCFCDKEKFLFGIEFLLKLTEGQDYIVYLHILIHKSFLNLDIE